MIIPLEKRLKTRLHADIARLQDEVLEIACSIDPALILHGGTAVWRCYGGNRFSEDIDLYCADVGKIEAELPGRITGRGLSMPKLKKTANLIFCKISNGSVEVRLEINFSKGAEPVVRQYEKTDGTFMSILTLSEENLLLEKMHAYAGRRFIRDIYDVYHLSVQIRDDVEVKMAISKFLESIQEPVDEKNLKAIIYSGAVPSFRQIAEALRRQFA